MVVLLDEVVYAYDEPFQKRHLSPIFLVYDTDDDSVCRRRRISERKSCRRARSNKHGLSDTRSYGVDSNDILFGKLTVLKDLNLHKLAAYQGFLLSRGNDVSSDNSS